MFTYGKELLDKNTDSIFHKMPLTKSSRHLHPVVEGARESVMYLMLVTLRGEGQPN